VIKMEEKEFKSGVAYCACDKWQECNLNVACVDDMPQYCPFDGKKTNWNQIKKSEDNGD
jgi:hypothetical protein